MYFQIRQPPFTLVMLLEGQVIMEMVIENWL